MRKENGEKECESPALQDATDDARLVSWRAQLATRGRRRRTRVPATERLSPALVTGITSTYSSPSVCEPA